MSAYIIEPEKKIPVRMECDVCVAGGGTAGCIAAIAAARAGAKTVLLEQLPHVGGTLGNGGLLINTFHSSYVGSWDTVRKIVGGIPSELVDRLIEAGGTAGYVRMRPEVNPHRRPYQVIVDHEIQKIVLANMLEEAGVTLLLHTFLSQVTAENGRVSSVIIESKSGREAICAKEFIDCTGDGDLAIGAGARWQPFYNDYHIAPNTGFVFSVANVDLEKLYAFLSAHHCVEENASHHNERGGLKDGYLRLNLSFQNSPELLKKLGEAGFPKTGMLLFSMHGNTIDYVNTLGLNGVDVNDTAALTHAEVELRRQALQTVNAMKSLFPGCENAFLCWQGTKVGIRASRTVLCDYSVSIEDTVSSRRFDDEIGMYGYQDYAPIGSGLEIQKKGAYGLLYRMILPQGLENVWVAGRHITEEEHAHMSTRNTVCCMEQGQAAGAAAALCAAKGRSSRELPYADLRALLEEQGVYFDP